jgi:MFS family permease
MSVHSVILGRSRRRGVRPAGTGLSALCAVVGLSAFDRLLIAALLTPIAHAFRVSLGTATVTATVYLIATGLAQVSHGQLSDRIGRAGALRVALIALAVGNAAAAAAAPTLTVLIAGRTVAGAASGGLVPGALVLLADRGHDQRRTRGQAVLIAALGFGTALAALAGLADHGWAWRIPLGISAAAAIALIAATRPSGPVSVPAVSRAGWRLLANPQVRVLALVAVPEGATVLASLSSTPQL